MTDFFADLERELRRAHRRDSERHPSSGVFELRRLLPVRPATGLPAELRRKLIRSWRLTG
jgi:hypothetical protein